MLYVRCKGVGRVREGTKKRESSVQWEIDGGIWKERLME